MRRARLCLVLGAFVLLTHVFLLAGAGHHAPLPGELCTDQHHLTVPCEHQPDAAAHSEHADHLVAACLAVVMAMALLRTAGSTRRLRPPTPWLPQRSPPVIVPPTPPPIALGISRT